MLHIFHFSLSLFNISKKNILDYTDEYTEIGTDIQPITKSSRLGLMEKFCIMFESAGATLNVKSEFLKVKRDWNIFVLYTYLGLFFLDIDIEYQY